MAHQAEQVSATGLVDTKQQPGPTKRRQYPEALKRQMAAETQAPGASVSIVARRHDVNSNQLFRLRIAAAAVAESSGRNRGRRRLPASSPTPREMAAPLERFWARRTEAEEIGKAEHHRIQRWFRPSRCTSLQKTSRRWAG
jgi:transposase